MRMRTPSTPLQARTVPKPITARARRSAALIAASSAVTAASAGRGLAPAMRPRRRGPAALSRALAGGFAAALSVAGIGHAAAEAQLWRCTNPQSGAQWTVSVDFARAGRFAAGHDHREVDQLA